jgi:catechol 2,3-dioxygenase-like lactoylglutathione lyase family enzyme
MTGPSAALSHLALSVSDLDRLRRFYEEAFGFESAEVYESKGRRAAALMETSPDGFRGVFLRRGPVLIELLQYAGGAPGERVPRPAMEFGYAHISFIVDDAAAAAARVEAAGGQLRTRLEHHFSADGPETSIVFCTDPDGNRVELISHPTAAEAEAHAAYLGLDRIGWPASTAIGHLVDETA